MFDSKLICKIPKCQNKDNEIAQENVGIAQINEKLRESFSKYKDEKVEKSEHENCKIPDMIYKLSWWPRYSPKQPVLGTHKQVKT